MNPIEDRNIEVLDLYELMIDDRGRFRIDGGIKCGKKCG